MVPACAYPNPVLQQSLLTTPLLGGAGLLLELLPRQFITAEHRLALYRLSWRPFPAPGRVGSCSRIKGEAIILPWLTNELKGKSSGLHNTRYSGWDIRLGTPQWLPKGSLAPGEQSRHRQGLCEPWGEHTIPGVTYEWGQAVGSSCPTQAPSLTAGHSDPPGRGHCNSFITKFQSPCTVFTMSLFKGSAVLLGLGTEGFFLRIWGVFLAIFFLKNSTINVEFGTHLRKTAQSTNTEGRGQFIPERGTRGDRESTRKRREVRAARW